MSMKILQVIVSLSSGGAEGFVTNLSVALTGLGAKVRLFVLGGVRRERGNVLLKRLHNVGIEVMGVEERKIASFSNLIRLTQLIRSWKPDIVHANLYPAEVACAWVRVLLVGNKACYVRRLANTDVCAYRPRWIVKSLDRVFHLTIACSPSVFNAYREFMGEKRRSKISTITNGGLLLDSVPDAKEKRGARKALGISEKAFVVTNIGRMYGGGKRLGGGLETGQKSHDILLKAFARAFGNNLNSVLILMGDGPLRSEAEALAKSLNLEEQARFLGEQPEPWQVLRASDVFCFPSRNEGLPNALIEAASCGLPVVASNIPEISDLYPGEAWLLKPVDDVTAFADGLRTIRKNVKMFTSIAREAARGIRERFSIKVCAMKYMHAYKCAIGCKINR